MKEKGGPAMAKFATYFRDVAKKQKPNATQDEIYELAKQVYLREKSANNLKSIMARVMADMAAKKQKKKDAKKQ